MIRIGRSALSLNYVDFALTMRTEIFTLSACATEEAALDNFEPAIDDHQWYTK